MRLRMPPVGILLAAVVLLAGAGAPAGATGEEPPQPSAEQISAGVLAQLVPTGADAGIATLLKRPLSLPFEALSAGSLTIVWYYVARGAHLARAKPKPVPIAAAGGAFSKAGRYTLKLRLTIRGRRILRHAKRLAVTARGAFTPSGGAAVVAKRAFTLKR